MFNFSSQRQAAEGRPALPPGADLPAFNRLIQAHQARLYTIAYRTLGSAALAEAATQSAVEEAFRQSPAALDPAAAEALLLRCLIAALRRASLEAPPANDGPLGHLPFNLRLPLVLIDVAGLDYERAADALYISLIELIQQLAQGRALLCRRPGSSPRAA